MTGQPATGFPDPRKKKGPHKAALSVLVAERNVTNPLQGAKRVKRLQHHRRKFGHAQGKTCI
jgi:hypothetical protein